MSDSPTTNNIQSIIKKVQAGGDFTIGEIQQLLDYNLTNQIHSGSGDNVGGNKNVTNNVTNIYGDNVAGDKVTGDKITNNFYLTPPEKFRPKNTPHNIPRSNTIKFVGRAESLQFVNQQLKDKGQLAITAVKGMGGIGKTELAIQYSYFYLLAKSYEGGICWLKAREENIGLQVIRFARSYLGIEPPDDLDLESQVEYCWSRWQSVKEGDVLVVIDDMTDYEEVEPYLPPQPSNFKILITTRLNIEDFPSISLEVLADADAIELLRQWVGKDKIDQQIEDVKELCKQLGNLPLALNLVGRYVQKRKITIRELLKRLEEKGLSDEAFVINKKKDPTLKASTKRIKRGVAAALELSWDELSNEAKHLSCVLSIFALAPIQWELIKELEKDIELEDLESDRIELEELHLVRSPSEETYQLHQLVREYFQDKLEKLTNKDILKRNYVEIMVNWSRKMPQRPTVKDIDVFTRIIPHVMETANNLTNFLKTDNEEIFGIFTMLAWFYQGQGLYELALPWKKTCLSETKQRLGEEHPLVATSLNNLAELYYSQGKYEDAEPLFIDALQMTKTLLGEQHPDTATSLNNLALLYKSQGKYKEAEPLYLDALQIYKTQFGEQHLSVATSINNLALLYYNQGRYEEAETLYLDALQIYKTQFGEQHLYVADSLNNLAGLYESQGKYEEAEPLYISALDMRKILLGEQHPDVAQSLNNLATLYREQGKYEKAETLYISALDMRKILLGEQHPLVATSVNNLATLYREQGKYEKAEPLFLDGLQMRKTQLGEQHPSVAKSLNNLAGLYYSQGKYEKAEPLYLSALEIHKTLLGEQHPLVATSVNNLATLYREQGKYEKAEPLFLESLQICKTQLGEQHPSVATSLNNLAGLYYSQGKYEKAEPFFIDSLEIAFNVLGQDHPNTNVMFNNLVDFIQQVIKANKTDILSDRPLTQNLLQQLQG